MPKLLEKIRNNLNFAIRECETPTRKGPQTKQWLKENISEFIDKLEILGIEQKDLSITKPLNNLNLKLNNINNEEPFVDKPQLFWDS